MANSTLDIEPSDVIRILEQYLKENNLFRTLQTLQDETSVSLNTVDSVEAFVHDIHSGHWDVVLKTIKLLKVPDHKLIELHEQIVIELIELRETRAANWMIHKTEPMMKMKAEMPDRHIHLQNLVGRSYFDPKEAYRDGSTRERRREAIASSLKKEVTVVPPQRLLSLISDALKWQRHEGLLASQTSIDLFTGKALMTHAEEETFPNILHKHCVKPLMGSDDNEPAIFVCCAEFSPDGHYLIVGYSTGLIEVRNPTTGRISFDLKYQAQKNYIITPSKTAALCVCFSSSEMVAIGDKSGDISVWKLETGQLIQTFKSAHLKSVSCILFYRNGKEILSGGHDYSVKLHGMRSNKTIRDYRGHKSFVKALACSRDDHFIVTGGSDSIVKIWNAKTAQVLKEYTSQSKIHTIQLMTNFKSDIFLVGDRSTCLQLIDLDGKRRTKLIYDPASETKERNELEDPTKEPREAEGNEIMASADFYAACSSPKGNYVYAVDSKHIYCFNYTTKKVQRKLIAHEESSNDLIGIRHHPFLNLIATYDTQGNLKLWKP